MSPDVEVETFNASDSPKVLRILLRPRKKGGCGVQGPMTLSQRMWLMMLFSVPVEGVLSKRQHHNPTAPQPNSAWVMRGIKYSRCD